MNGHYPAVAQPMVDWDMDTTMDDTQAAMSIVSPEDELVFVPATSENGCRTVSQQLDLYEYCDDDINRVFKEIAQLSANTAPIEQDLNQYQSFPREMRGVIAASMGPAGPGYQWNEEDVELIFQDADDCASVASNGIESMDSESLFSEISGCSELTAATAVTVDNRANVVVDHEMAQFLARIEAQIQMINALPRMRSGGYTEGAPTRMYGCCVERRRASSDEEPSFTAAEVAGRWVGGVTYMRGRGSAAR